MKKSRPYLTLVTLALVLACARPPDLESERTAILAADEAWLKAVQEKNADAAGQFIAADGMMMAPNAPSIVGSEAVRQYMAQMIAIPGFSITWNTTRVEVAASGDLAYSIGTNQIEMPMPDGTTAIDRGKAVTIWKKQSDGTWKVAADIFNSDLPMTAAVPDTTASGE
jgi:uncharacterized protein (TIGR02246 family)